MFPIEGNNYVPSPPEDWAAPDIEYVRAHGRLTMVSGDGTTALVEVRRGLTISYCAVILHPDGTIGDFVPRAVNTYGRTTPVKSSGIVREAVPGAPRKCCVVSGEWADGLGGVGRGGAVRDAPPGVGPVG